MQIRLTPNPGQRGIRKLSEQSGEQLLCVRYRYDARMRKRTRTIEVIVAETDWLPPEERFALDEIVWLRIGFVDREQQQKLRAAGATWDSRRCAEHSL